MSHDEVAGFPLPRGATGFFRPEDGPLPRTDPRAFRRALHAAARASGGAVGEVEEQAYPLTFHTAAITERGGERVVLCHAHHPWIAFAETRRNWYTEQFTTPPPWARSFSDAGFVVLTREQLTRPLSDADTSALTREERRQARCYGVDTLGGLLFNAWA
jgi:hypothetical protein